MRKGMFGFLVVLCCGVLLASGCAKKDVVRQDAPVVAPQPSEVAKATAAEDAAAKEAAAKSAVETKQEVIARTVDGVTDDKEVKAAAAKEVPQPAELEQALAAIYFAFDSPALSPEARDTLSKNAGFLSKKTDLKIKIEGHCDERGSDEYNLALGERRAKSAKDYLETLGIQKDRLSTISYGKEKPVDPGHDEAAWAKNRRDEFVITK